MAVGQYGRITGARIAGLVSCVPPRIVDNAFFEQQFGAEAVENVTKMIGVRARHYVDEGVATSDMCYAAAIRLCEELGWSMDSIDGIIFVSQSGDYPLPATSCILQARLGMRTSTLAFDIGLGCSGYGYGLFSAMSAVQTGALKRVLLCVGDVSTRGSDPDDRATVMLFGDCGTVTAIEASDDPADIAHFVMGTDGRGAENLMMPKSKHRIFKPEGRFAGRDPEMLFMDGGEIFNFTITSVPPLILETVAKAGQTVDDYDAFCLHQANTFMVKHIAKKAKLPKDRVPINMDRYGNTSSASVPLLMTTDIADQLKERRCRLGLFGFGVGYSWVGVSLEVGPLPICETIILQDDAVVPDRAAASEMNAAVRAAETLTGAEA